MPLALLALTISAFAIGTSRSFFTTPALELHRLEGSLSAL